MCAEPIKADATKCPSCGESLVATAAPKKSGLPMIAIVAILAMVLVGVGCILAAIAIPSLAPARKPGNEAAAIGALKMINTSQTLFREADKDEDGTLDYAGSLTELSAATLIDGVLGTGSKQGYTFQVAVAPATPEFLWMAVASPLVPGSTGDRYFVTNQAGVIYYSTTAPFTITADCAIPGNATPLGR